MTEQQRTRLRLKQDFLVMLAGMSNYEEYLRIDEKDTAPSIAQLRIAVYPDWEGIVDRHIQSMANRMSPKVGVPDFAYLAASMPHTNNYECIDASGRCMVTGEV